MKKVIHRLLVASGLIFLVVLLYVYVHLPEEVNILPPPYEIFHGVLSREAFFYVVLGIFVGMNTLLLGLVSLIKIQSIRNTGLFSQPTFKVRLQNWLCSFSLILNLLYLAIIFLITTFNSPKSFS